MACDALALPTFDHTKPARIISELIFEKSGLNKNRTASPALLRVMPYTTRIVSNANNTGIRSKVYGYRIHAAHGRPLPHEVIDQVVEAVAALDELHTAFEPASAGVGH